MKPFHGVIRWTVLLLTPVLIHVLAPNMALNIVNSVGARMLLTSAQLRDALSWMDPSPEQAPTAVPPGARDRNASSDASPPTVAGGE
jgi:hypothetical protein